MNSRRLLTDDEFRDVSEEVLPFGQSQGLARRRKESRRPRNCLDAAAGQRDAVAPTPSIGHPGRKAARPGTVQCHSFDTA